MATIEAADLAVLAGLHDFLTKFDEDQHPRDDHGRFASDGGGGTADAATGNDKLTHAMYYDTHAPWNVGMGFQHISDDKRGAVKAEIVAARGADLTKAATDNPAVQAEMRAQYLGTGQGGVAVDRGRLETDYLVGKVGTEPERGVRSMTDTELYGQLKAQAYVDQWAASAADSESASLAMQIATARELGASSPAFDEHLATVDQGGIGSSVSAGTWAMVNDEGATMRAYVRSEYDATQTYLRERGIDEVTLYRGMSFGANDPPMPLGWAQGGQHDIAMNPASSWSVDRDIARSFAGSGGGGFSPDPGANNVLLTMRVPAADVISTARTGRGALIEGEVLVRSQPGQRAETEMVRSIGQEQPEYTQPALA